MEVDNNPPPPSSYGTVSPGTWRCLVCQKPTNEIHVLPCQHKFCMNCLELWAGIYMDMYHGRDSEFPCQVCWKLYVVPDQGMSAYQQDFQVNQLENSLQQMTFGQQGQGHQSTRGPFEYNVTSQGQWDAGTTAEAVFPPDPEVTMQAATTTDRDLCEPQSMIQNSHYTSDITSDHQATVVQSPGVSTSPSMVSHMVAQTFRTAHYSSTECPRGADYCVRSHHLHMHMV